MLAEKAHIQSSSPLILSKISSYVQFSKFRLASLVVFSAVITFIVAVKTGGGDYTGMQILWLTLGGFLVTAASNGYNQVIEKDLDKLMSRTMNRPLPQNKMSVTEGIILASIMGIGGVFILGYYLNPLTGLLGLIALILYALVYTPMKRKTPFAVFVGAFPGALPPLIGWVAYANEINFFGLSVFAVQFMWQFPHFWAIAWRLHEDYTKAGFKMLPSPGGRDKASAFQILLYSLFLIPVSLLPGAFLLSGMFYTVVAIIAGSVFAYQAYTLYTKLDIASATKLMFGSFLYLPIVQLALLIDYYLK
ncbi:MAG: heme o synthase [Bacteroidetes bacterium]|nr:heme o synthase [Bacteroidota bacterium]